VLLDDGAELLWFMKSRMNNATVWIVKGHHGVCANFFEIKIYKAYRIEYAAPLLDESPLFLRAVCINSHERPLY
jgi:hypothetical protein